VAFPQEKVTFKVLQKVYMYSENVLKQISQSREVTDIPQSSEQEGTDEFSVTAAYSVSG
jgi:hypothetical protein